jgi:hypothetical protein
MDELQNAITTWALDNQSLLISMAAYVLYNAWVEFEQNRRKKDG